MKHQYLKNVTTLELNQEKCTGCGMCTQVCPHGVFATENRKALIRERDLCMECGACAKNCPAEAIQVRAGVGCAYAITIGALKGGEPTCGCDESSSCCN